MMGSDSELRWDLLIFGRYSQKQVLAAVQDQAWQRVRRSMLNTPQWYKYNVLTGWLHECQHSEKACIQITNYVNALKRGGLVR